MTGPPEIRLHDCQIDCALAWRPGFDDVIMRLRIAFFPQRLLITAYDDASELETETATLFDDKPSTPWREVLKAVLACDEKVLINGDWPGEVTLVHPSQMAFDRVPGIAVKLVALAWLGDPWNRVAEALCELSDTALSTADQTSCLLEVAEETVSEIEKIPADELPHEDHYRALITRITARTTWHPSRQLDIHD